MSPPHPKAVSIIIAVYNQRNLLQHFHTVLCETLWRLPYDFEIILVDDGSTDKSADLVAGMSKRDQRIRLLIMPQHLGREAAIAIGLRSAHGAAVIILDATATHQVGFLPRMLQLWEEGARMVTIPLGVARLRLVDRAVVEMYSNRLDKVGQQISPFDRMEVPGGLTLFLLPAGLEISTRLGGSYFAACIARLRPRTIHWIAAIFSLAVFIVYFTTTFLSIWSGVILLVAGWILYAMVFMIIAMAKEWQDRPFVELGSMLRHVATSDIEYRAPSSSIDDASDETLVGHSQPINTSDRARSSRTGRFLTFVRHFPPAAYG